MDYPKPHPPTGPIAVGEVTSTKPKPSYVLKPHLTDRPLRGNEILMNLQKSMLESAATRPRRK